MWFLWRLSLNLLKKHILFGNRLRTVRFKNGDLRKWFEKTTLRAEFPKRTWFLRRLSLNLLKNHILFGNGLWKVRFENTENGDLRKRASRAEFPKGTYECGFSQWRYEAWNYRKIEKPHSFWTSALKSQIWKWWPPYPPYKFTSRILKKNMVFVEIKPESTQKPHSFWKSALKSQIWRWWFEKTTFTSRILKRNVVFEEIKI